MSRRLLVILVLLASVFGLMTALAVQRGLLAPKDQTAAVGGPFQLVDQTGRTVDQSVLKGKWSAVFFGYTDCPDVCPTTLFSLGQAEKLLGAQAADFQTVFITVDPERDTPKRLAGFLGTQAFPQRLLGLTGTQDQVAKAASAYHVYFQKRGKGAAYPVDHSTIVYLMNPRGRFVCVIRYDAAPQQMAGEIVSAMRQGDKAESC
jgi:protein SCO1/2